jgi:trimethylamine:corrinoid methyltransferase-like protein
MRHVKFQINGGLSEQDIKRMWEGAVYLIEEFGLRVPHEGIRSILAGFDGVKIEGDLVKFSADLVSKAIANQDYSDLPKELGPDNPGIVAGAYIKNVIDPETDKIRPATLQDLVDYTKLCDSYGFYGPPCVRPNDAPVELQRILMYKTSYEYSRVHAHGILDVAGWLNPREARYGKELADVAGKDFRVDLWLISPFLAPEEGLSILYEFRDEPVDMNVATMPVSGTTAPIRMLDAYIQSLGELFSALTLIYLVNERKKSKGKIRCVIVDSIRAYPFDMKYASFVYGSAEDLLGTLYQAQLNRYFGIPLVAKSLLTTAKYPDAHAAGEKAAHTMAAVLSGAYLFANAGLLSVDEIYSIQQLLIDREIVQFCLRVVRGDEFHEDLSGVDLIKEVGHWGTFLDHETTYKEFKKCLWDPEIFTHQTLNQWQERGSKSPGTIAKESALLKIKSHSYRIDERVKKELDRIYERAAGELCR